MKFSSVEWSLNKLILILEENKINLNPPYQRNDIWSNPAKRKLIDSIKRSYPLPVFFFHDKGKGFYDVVDGQQRIRAIYGFRKGFFKDLDNLTFEDLDKGLFENYTITVTIISDVGDDNILSDFYFRVNNYGTKLNRPETLKAQYQNTDIQKLINELADSDDFRNLHILSNTSLNRMADLDLIGELLGLIEFGVIEKKTAPDNLYKYDLSKNKLEFLFTSFMEVLDVVSCLNNVYPISKTRYKQRNDFYTLWGFIKDNISLKSSSFEYFYKVLVLIGEDIAPSNTQSVYMANYAFNCVSQSNSKKARIERSEFLKLLLLNTTPQKNEVQQDVMRFYDLDGSDLIKIENKFTINGKLLQEKIGYPDLFN